MRTLSRMRWKKKVGMQRSLHLRFRPSYGTILPLFAEQAGWPLVMGLDALNGVWPSGTAAWNSSNARTFQWRTSKAPPPKTRGRHAIDGAFYVRLFFFAVSFPFCLLLSPLLRLIVPPLLRLIVLPLLIIPALLDLLIIHPLFIVLPRHTRSLRCASFSRQ